MGLSVINHLFWGSAICGNPHMPIAWNTSNYSTNMYQPRRAILQEPVNGGKCGYQTNTVRKSKIRMHRILACLKNMELQQPSEDPTNNSDLRTTGQVHFSDLSVNRSHFLSSERTQFFKWYVFAEYPKETTKNHKAVKHQRQRWEKTHFLFAFFQSCPRIATSSHPWILLSGCRSSKVSAVGVEVSISTPRIQKDSKVPRICTNADPANSKMSSPGRNPRFFAIGTLYWFPTNTCD